MMTMNSSEQALPNLLHAVEQITGVPSWAILGKRRRARVADARHVFMYIARHTTPFTYEEIGLFCHRDHSSVVHAVNKIEDWVSMYPHVRETVEKVMGALNGKN